MAFIADTAFQPRVWNNRNNDTQIVPGRFYSGSTPADCSAGWLCNAGAIDEKGVRKMTEAADGSKPLYACFPSDTPRLKDNNGNLYAVGSRTLGLGLPAGRVGDFVELVENEIYSFSTGNLAAPIAGGGYLSVEDGTMNPSSSAPSSGYYFQLIEDLCEDVFTEGSVAGGTCITVKYCHA